MFCFWPETSHILPHYEYGDFLILMSERVYFYFGFCSAFPMFSLTELPNFWTFGCYKCKWYLVEDKSAYCIWLDFLLLLWRTDSCGCKWNPERSFSQESPDGKGCTSSAVTTIPLSFSLFLLFLQRFLQKRKNAKTKKKKKKRVWNYYY